MTKGELKKILQDDKFIESIVNISKDPTLGSSKKEQLQGLIFLKLTDEYWDSSNDNEVL